MKRKQIRRRRTGIPGISIMRFGFHASTSEAARTESLCTEVLRGDISQMTTNECEQDGVFVTEKHMSREECRAIYGTDDVAELNPRFADAAQRATGGNCSQWAIYANDGITVVTEC